MYIKGHIRQVFRTIWRHKSFSLFNVFGLAAGIALGLMVLLVVKFEFSYDHQFTHHQRIYRLTSQGKIGMNDIRSSISPLPANRVLNGMDELVESATQLIPASRKLVRFEDKVFSEDRMFYGDTAFFTIFDVPFLSGEKATCLKDPFSVVISHSAALRYFNYADPMGKILELENGIKVTVTGVCEDIQPNAHLHVDLLVSANTLDERMHTVSDSLTIKEWKNNWLALTCYNYLLAKPSVSPEHISKVFNELKDVEMTPQAFKFFSEESLTANQTYLNFVLQPIASIHLYSNYDDEIEPTSRVLYVHMLLLIGLMILLVTALNFINLTTARIHLRMQEMAVRHLHGAGKWNLFWQLIFESVIYCLLALFVGLVFVELTFPLFDWALELGLKISQVRTIREIAYSVLIALGLGVFTGLFPALFYSRIQAQDLFKKNITFGKTGIKIRGSLVFIQVVVTVVLTILATAIFWQLNTLRQTKLGYNPSNLLVLERGYAIGDSLIQFKKELLSHPEIEKVTSCSFLPGDKHSVYSVRYLGISDKPYLLWNINMVDDDFLQTIQVNLSSGQFFDPSQNDSLLVSINETAANTANLRKPIGELIEFVGMNKNDPALRISGMVKDFYFDNLKQQIPPMLFVHNNNKHYQYILVRFSEGKEMEASKIINDIWTKHTINQPFTHFLLEQRLNTFTNSDYRLLKLVIILAIFAIFMNCLSLIGLTLFFTFHKRNELSVRKMLGASSLNLLYYLFLNLFGYILAAIGIAIPIAWYISKLYVDIYVIQNPLPFYMYLPVVVIIAAISFAIVFIEAYRAMKQLTLE
jgi:ABC-type antimicrobial peptide transport system permease subunit